MISASLVGERLWQCPHCRSAQRFDQFRQVSVLSTWRAGGRNRIFCRVWLRRGCPMATGPNRLRPEDMVAHRRAAGWALAFIPPCSTTGSCPLSRRTSQAGGS